MMLSRRPSLSGAEWVLTVALAITSTVGYGVYYYAFGVILPGMEQGGWSRSVASGAFSLALLVAGVAALPLGWWVDRRGARGLMVAGSLLGAASVWLWSRADGPLALYAAFTGLGLALAATTYEVSFNVVAAWLGEGRKRAMLVITLFGALASTIFIPLTTHLRDSLGWPAALQILAGVLLLVTLPIHALLVRNPGREKQGPSPSLPWRDTLRSPAFRRLTLAFSLARVAQMALVAHMILLLTSLGLPAATVALAVGLIGVMQLLGRVLFAGLDHLPPARLTAAGFTLQAAACLSLLLLPPGAGLWVFVTLLGTTNGLLTLTRPVLIAEQFHPTQFGRVNGSMTLVGAVVQTVGPVGAAWLSSHSGNYQSVILLLTVCFVFAAWTVAHTESVQ